MTATRRNASPPPAVRPGAARNRLRIIGGDWRSRIVRFPDAAGLRPTPDRVRETLFNWLGQDLTGRSCLDLFAGSGALGFEALSRNAQSVTMVEREARARDALAAHAQLLGAGARARIEGGDALQFLRECRAVFDVIFLDPPFGSGLVDRAWPWLDALLATDGVVYVESGTTFEVPAGWRALKRSQAGSVCYQLLARNLTEAPNVQ